MLDNSSEEASLKTNQCLAFCLHQGTCMALSIDLSFSLPTQFVAKHEGHKKTMYGIQFMNTFTIYFVLLPGSQKGKKETEKLNGGEWKL